VGQKKVIGALVASRTEEARLVERAKVVMGCLEGKPVIQIARELGVRPNTVITWWERFAERGVAGLRDLPRSGKPVVHGAEFRKQVLELLETPPPNGRARRDGPSVAQRLNDSDDAVWPCARRAFT